MISSWRASALAFVVDVLLVLVFVLIGRTSHGEHLTLAGVWETLWPFAGGLAVGWLATMWSRHPLRIVFTGLVLWILTVAIGMLLRIANGQGVEMSFVIVASIVLGVFLLGWRGIARAVLAATRRRRSAQTGR